MAGVNKAIILGRLGKDPETRTLDNGTVVTNFSIATSESFKDKNTGEKKEVTDWHNCVAWRAVGEIAAKYLHKGDMVYVEGKIKTRSWEKDGVTRYVTEIVVDNLTLLGGGNKQNSNDAGSGQPSSSSGESKSQDSGASSFIDDLPF